MFLYTVGGIKMEDYGVVGTFVDVPYVDISKYMKSYRKCPKCGEYMLLDTSVVLTSYPPQYPYKCEHCGHYDSSFDWLPNYEAEAKDKL